MKKLVINVGILDDDETKRTQIISNLESGLEGADDEIEEQYNSYELNPIELEIKSEMDQVLEQLIEKKINVLVVDYKLTSYEAAVDYTGVKFAKRANEKYLNFPIFVLTSFESELYKQESFNAYQVFDCARYLEDDAERIELNRKIIEQYLMYKKQINDSERELAELLTHEGESEEINKRILELDDFLEKSLDGENAIPFDLKKRLCDDKFDTVIALLKRLVEEE